MSTTTPDPGPSQPTGLITLPELLRDRSFRLYIIGQATSASGSALASVALVFAVLATAHHSASSVGVVLLASRLPGVGLVLAGGVVADRYSRTLVAIYADTARTALQLATGALLLSGNASVFALASLQFASGAAGMLFRPAANALLESVAPQGELRRADSLLGITTAIAQAGGLAVSGAIVAMAGCGAALLIDGASFAVSALTMALLPRAEVPRRMRSSLLQQLSEGWKLAARHRWLVGYGVHETVINVLVLGPFFVLGPVVAKSHLGGAPAWSAIALGYVAGNLVAGSVTYHWAPKRPVLAAISISLALSPMPALIALCAPIWVIVPAALLAGAAATISNTLLNTALQANLPVDTLGRAGALAGVGSAVLVPAGMGLAGVIATALGTATVLLAGAGLVIAVTLTCVSLPAVRAELTLDRARVASGERHGGTTSTVDAPRTG